MSPVPYISISHEFDIFQVACGETNPVVKKKWL